MCVEEKRFSLVLPKGKAPQGGWKILATSLRSIRVVPVSRPLEESKEPIRCLFYHELFFPPFLACPTIGIEEEVFARKGLTFSSPVHESGKRAWN